MSNRFGGVGQLRQQFFRRHERAHLDLALAGGVGGVDPGQLLRGGQNGLDALQPVTQADFANDDCWSWRARSKSS